MSTARHYPKAPITEAIIDLRVEARDDIEIQELDMVGDGVEKDYPKRESLFQSVTTIQIKPGVPTTAPTEQQQIGFRFITEDEGYIWQSRRNGFTFSRLAPYETWASLRDEARRNWTLYREQARPQAIRRLAVRYINRIDISSRCVELKDYFRTFPEVSPELQEPLSGFLMQLRMPERELKGQVLINQTIIPSEREGVVSVVLDIDLFRDTDVPDDEGEIWEVFEKLHDRKNEIFEACITNKARELFE